MTDEPSDPIQPLLGRTGLFYRPPDNFDQLSEGEQVEAMIPFAERLYSMAHKDEDEPQTNRERGYWVVGQDEWIEHRRLDGELIGWLRPEGEQFLPVDRLGRDISPATDWLSAERALDNGGIGYLADPFELRLDDGTWQRVRVIEISPTLIRLKKEDFGASGGPRVEYTLPFPAPGTLRAPPAGSGDGPG